MERALLTAQRRARADEPSANMRGAVVASPTPVMLAEGAAAASEALDGMVSPSRELPSNLCNELPQLAPREDAAALVDAASVPAGCVSYDDLS